MNLLPIHCDITCPIIINIYISLSVLSSVQKAIHPQKFIAIRSYFFELWDCITADDWISRLQTYASKFVETSVLLLIAQSLSDPTNLVGANMEQT